ncbi:TIGR04053 family radical SAM/SPASM domain-containing protein [Effusibacillus lacus]|uniref:Radical SAM protein n=1 Tax=Effusibacillus lacus TaxID=1348429 RepID=A0A292YQE4_9BACL|nr:TIGR04053 family radical SAM/SPASM domain-containing protein [Effusibacillus lacus]TCS76078.1 radical SAM protein [Effusibacillus lacus]GAX91406.1 radical SAM protein [Effusibacillus lacus]
MGPFEQSPFIVIWEITRACELACLHCRAEAQPNPDPRQLTTEEGFRLLDQIREFGDPVVVFTGGDPLMRPDLFELIKYGVGKGLKMSMTPSATPHVTKEAMRKAKEAGLSRWAFSIDGSNAEIHDAFRGVAGSFDLTMRSIEYLHELGLPIQINTTVSRYNLNDLDNLAALMKELKCVLWSVFFLVPTGRGKTNDMITPEEHEQVFNWLYDLSKTAPFDIKTTAAQHYRRVVMQRRKAEGETISRMNLLGVQRNNGETDDGIGRPMFGVNDGNGFVFISHLGDVQPSGFLPVVAGNVRERSLVNIYRNSPIFQSLRNPDNYKGKCGVCPFRNVCGGSRARAYAVTGDYLESEPYCTFIPPNYKKAIS